MNKTWNDRIFILNQMISNNDDVISDKVFGNLMSDCYDDFVEKSNYILNHKDTVKSVSCKLNDTGVDIIVK